MHTLGGTALIFLSFAERYAMRGRMGSEGSWIAHGGLGNAANALAKETIDAPQSHSRLLSSAGDAGNPKAFVRQVAVETTGKGTPPSAQS